MKIQTFLLILALVAVGMFLYRRVRPSGARGYTKRFDSIVPPPPQDSSSVYLPLYTDSGAAGSHHHAHSADCGHGSTDAGGGCSDGGGGGVN